MILRNAFGGLLAFSGVRKSLFGHVQSFAKGGFRETQPGAGSLTKFTSANGLDEEALGIIAMRTDVVQIPFALLHRNEPLALMETIGVAGSKRPHSYVEALTVGVGENLPENCRPEALALITPTEIQMFEEQMTRVGGRLGIPFAQDTHRGQRCAA